MTKKLAAWLEEHGYSDPADTQAAIGLAGNAARVLARAQELGESLNELSDKTKAAERRPRGQAAMLVDPSRWTLPSVAPEADSKGCMALAEGPLLAW